MDLVIVESPTKAKTIAKFLGPQYRVEPSFGHVRDLPQSTLGVDIEKNFEPKYVIIPKAKEKIKELKDATQKADSVILATDEDREGEAIAWHLAQALGLRDQKTKKQKNILRIVFHEITKQAIEEALKNPRNINMALVDAQQTRRILDRLVGYKLSPFLWKKIARGLSAGRVQSVAVRLVVEREREIEQFIPQEYWTIAARLKSKIKNQISKISDDEIEEFEAILIKRNEETIPKLGIKAKKEADAIVKDLDGAEYRMLSVEKKETFRLPPPPFTTSTLQQSAWQRFHFPAKFTMQIAQHLYEKGFITYHRTDSLNLAEQAVFSAKSVIQQLYGNEYALTAPRMHRTKSKTAQEAHEAIRPSYPEKTPDMAKTELEPPELKLYDLIWRRFIACQMQAARFDSTTADIEALNPKSQIKNIYTFRADGLAIKFDGFLKVYPMKFEETSLPPLEKNEALELLKLIPAQHFTQPPQRYNDATLVKALEAHGIGRPSTYAPIIETIFERNYIKHNDEKKFMPTDIGTLVNDVLVKHFPAIVDIDFTAKMEGSLDDIAEGKMEWTKPLQEFYGPFAETLAQKYREVSKKELTEQKIGEMCPSCGTGELVTRLGRFGKFIACSRFPECKYTQAILEATGVKCPKCKEGDLVEKITKKRKKFYACSRWPDCDFALWYKPTGDKCELCGSLMVIGARKRIFCSNKECRKTR